MPMAPAHASRSLAAALMTMTALVPAPAAANDAVLIPVAVKSAIPEDAATAIEKLMPVIERALKHPMVQVGGIALRGVSAYQLYVVRRDVGEVRQTTLAMLKDIAAVIARVDKGEKLSAAAWASAHQSLDLHAQRLRSLERRMDGAEQKVRAILARLSWRACPTFHKRVGKICLDARTLPELVRLP